MSSTPTGPQPLIVQQLLALKSLLATHTHTHTLTPHDTSTHNTPPCDESLLQQTLLEISSCACGQRGASNHSLGPKTVLTLLTHCSHDSKYSSVIQLFEQVKCPPERLLSVLDTALDIAVDSSTHSITSSDISTTQKSLDISSLISLFKGHSGAHQHSRTVLTPEMYRPVFDVLFALQICNPCVCNSMQYICKDYLEAEAVLDMPVSGEMQLWWGPDIPASSLWRAAILTSALHSCELTYKLKEFQFRGCNHIAMHITGNILRKLLSSNNSDVKCEEFGSPFRSPPPLLSGVIDTIEHESDGNISGHSVRLDVSGISSIVYDLHNNYITALEVASKIYKICPLSTSSKHVWDLQHLRLTVHSSQWFDALLYFILCQSCGGLEHVKSGSKRMRSESENSGECGMNNSTIRKAIQVIYYSNDWDLCLSEIYRRCRKKEDVDFAQEVDNSFGILYSIFLEDSRYTRDVTTSPNHRCRFHAIKQHIKGFDISNGISGRDDCLFYLLIRIMFQCVVLDIMMDTSNDGLFCGPTSLFDELLESFTVAKGTSPAETNSFQATSAYSLQMLLSIILNEVVLCDSSFLTYVSGAIQEFVIYGNDPALKLPHQIDHFPIKSIKRFLKRQLESSECLFSLLVSAVDAATGNMSATNSVRKVIGDV